MRGGGRGTTLRSAAAGEQRGVRASATGQRFRDGSYDTRRLPRWRRTAKARVLRDDSSLALSLSLPLYNAASAARAVPRLEAALSSVPFSRGTLVHVALDRPPTMDLTRATVRWADDDVALLDLCSPGCLSVSLPPSPFLLRRSRARLSWHCFFSLSLARARDTAASLHSDCV